MSTEACRAVGHRFHAAMGNQTGSQGRRVDTYESGIKLLVAAFGMTVLLAVDV
jgi:hypothetical protein